ncbi:hypothetical protein F4678DRAFT_466483 [Xylaria arbuscula]|nr:hypothetical protein F4678DRAFT_466483 [Xylaria arbuscula]
MPSPNRTSPLYLLALALAISLANASPFKIPKTSESMGVTPRARNTHVPSPTELSMPDISPEATPTETPFTETSFADIQANILDVIHDVVYGPSVDEDDDQADEVSIKKGGGASGTRGSGSSGGNSGSGGNGGIGGSVGSGNRGNSGGSDDNIIFPWPFPYPYTYPYPYPYADGDSSGGYGNGNHKSGHSNSGHKSGGGGVVASSPSRSSGNSIMSGDGGDYLPFALGGGIYNPPSWANVFDRPVIATRALSIACAAAMIVYGVF